MRRASGVARRAPALLSALVRHVTILRQLAVVRRGRVVLAALVVAVGIGGAPAVGAAAPGTSTAPWSFGPFAGYDWFGPLRTVEASFTVPAIRGGRNRASAATWIGASAPGGSNGPFIQIGVNEGCQDKGSSTRPCTTATPPDSYEAFWSDTRQDFSPRNLLVVNAGDSVTVAMSIAHGQWKLSFDDTTLGQTRRVTTTQETGVQFNDAEWLQEDVTNGDTNTVYPYPTLSTVRFTDLRVNGKPPRYGAMFADWMSLPHSMLAPGPLSGDAVQLRTATISPAGLRYLRLARPVNESAEDFLSASSDWTVATPPAKTRREITSFTRVIARSLKALNASPWPAAARSAVAGVTRKSAMILRGLHVAARLGPEGLVTWASNWDDAWGNFNNPWYRAGHLARRALHLPEEESWE
jgi:hypothetical protein